MRTIRQRTANSLLKSALVEEGAYRTVAQAVTWLSSFAAERPQVVREITFEELGEWSFAEKTGDLVHKSGQFFRVTGVRVSTDLGLLTSWDQPIIDQPEIGILGIIARDIDGVMHLLMQAKMEPGNPSGVQLTPTVQATRSNYTQVHQGSRPRYLDYFLNRDRSRVIVDQLQWEHGSAFLKKRNRNVVLEVDDDDLPAEPGFEWLTLGQVKKLLEVPNLVSMDTRTVIACLPIVDAHRKDWRSEIGPNVVTSLGAAALDSLGSPEAHSADYEVQSWLTDLKCRHHLTVVPIGLSQVSGWHRTDRAISHSDAPFFRVIAVDVESRSREVVHWTQPMIASRPRGLIAFVISQIDGLLHVLVKARAEPGSADTLILGPTVQSALGFESTRTSGDRSGIVDLVANAAADDIRYSNVQSEEGGRFHHVESEYRIVEIADGDRLSLPPEYLWLSLRQVHELLQFGLLSVEARSLLACLSFL